ncbi:hypothetical protein ACOXXX_03535 [Thalassococcus sp. BH17M4-6]
MTKIEPTLHDRGAYGQMTIAELLDVHNDLAERCGTDVLKSWKRAKPELIDRIEALGADQADTHEPETTEKAEPTDDEADDTPEQPKRTIGALVQELLMDEALGYEAILEQVMAEFSDAKTSVRSIASVAANLRKRGVDVPMRRKKKG